MPESPAVRQRAALSPPTSSGFRRRQAAVPGPTHRGSARPRPQPRPLAEQRALLDRAPLAQPRPRADHRVGADEASGADHRAGMHDRARLKHDIRAYLEAGNPGDQPGRYVAWLHRHEPVYAWVFDSTWYDIGDHEQLLEADNRMRVEAGLAARDSYTPD